MKNEYYWPAMLKNEIFSSNQSAVFSEFGGKLCSLCSADLNDVLNNLNNVFKFKDTSVKFNGWLHIFLTVTMLLYHDASLDDAEDITSVSKNLFLIRAFLRCQSTSVIFSCLNSDCFGFLCSIEYTRWLRSNAVAREKFVILTVWC